MPAIRTARVHLGTEKAKGFNSSAAARTGSVTIASSGGISPAQAKAIQYMTALAVAGLKPADVAVIEQAAQIKQSLISMLEARVGRGNARVSVSLDFNREHSTTAERRFDPDGRVLKSQTSNEVTDSATGTSNNVTVASNLPEGEAGGNENNSDREETSETVTYEISEIVKNTEILPGGITRMSVAVLINDIISQDEDGNITRTERSAQEIASLTELISSASGLNEPRGDVITVRSLPFDVPPLIDGVQGPSLIEQFIDRYLWSTVQALILASVILILGLFVVRPLLSPKALEGAEGLMPLSISGPDANDGLSLDMQSLPTLGGNDPLALPFDGGGETGAAMGSDLGAMGAEDPIDLLKSTVTEQTEAAADLLAQWLEQDELAAENG